MINSFCVLFFAGETPFQGKRGLPRTPSTKTFYSKKGMVGFFRECGAVGYGIFVGDGVAKRHERNE